MFDIGEAIARLKAGRYVAREGWNGKGMYLFLHVFVEPQPVIRAMRTYEPCIVMFTAQGRYQPGWLASQEDLMAEDWIEIEAQG